MPTYNSCLMQESEASACDITIPVEADSLISDVVLERSFNATASCLQIESLAYERNVVQQPSNVCNNLVSFRRDANKHGFWRQSEISAIVQLTNLPCNRSILLNCYNCNYVQLPLTSSETAESLTLS